MLKASTEKLTNLFATQKVAQLKAIAIQSGNLSSGVKAELVNRLVGHFEATHDEPGSIISFDLGYRNLAYCHLNKDAKILDWARVDLDLPSFHPSVVAPIVRQFIEDRVQANLKTTDRVLVELQRARSNGGHGVLEHTLRVNCVEAVLWAGLYEYVDKMKRPHIQMTALNRRTVDMLWQPQLDQIILEYPDKFKKLKPGYYYKKRASMLLVEQWIETDTEVQCNDHFKAMFEAEKKKDDLSDCLIQAVSWYKWTRFTNDYKNNLLKD